MNWVSPQPHSRTRSVKLHLWARFWRVIRYMVMFCLFYRRP